MTDTCVHAPAKINLFLAITGRLTDGFHDLISLVAPLELGDTLWLDTRVYADAKEDTLACTEPGVPVDASNLVLRAAAAFRRRSDANGGRGLPFIHFTLKKETPAGAGLGGGSSDAAAALRGMNHLAARPLAMDDLLACAAEVGSDVPLFRARGSVIMRGRGEQIQKLDDGPSAALRGRSVLLFKPPFGVATAWAYGRLKELAPTGYRPAAEAEAQLAAWLAAPFRAELPLENNLEIPVFEKYAALPVLLDELRSRFNLRCRMSGSGSACFALLEPDSPRAAIEQTIREAWGPEAFVRITRIA